MSFSQIQDFAGVDVGAPTPSIVVQRGNCNLIVHNNGPGLEQSNKPGIILDDITDRMKNGVGTALHYLQGKVGGNYDVTTMSSLLISASQMNLGGNTRLVAIFGNTVGDYPSTKIASDIVDVMVRNRLTFTLSFWYYKYNGGEHQNLWNKMGGGLDSEASSHDAVLTLNRYFIPQANIAFERKNLTEWKTDFWLDSTTKENRNSTTELYANISVLEGQKLARQNPDSSVDFRVFVVPQVFDGDAGAFSDNTSNAVFVPWFVPPAQRSYRFKDPKADVFIPELCHELIHKLRKDDGVHSTRAGVMCNLHTHSKLDEELLIDKVTLDAITAKPN